MNRTPKRRYAAHTHIGVYWDGGVRLLGLYRWFWLARIRIWWHVVVENPLRLGTVVPVTGETHETYHENHESWARVYAN